MVMTVNQAAEQCLADLIALALQAVNITAEK
jgi:hypothetical protein